MTQSIEQLENDFWPDPPEDSSGLVLSCYQLRRKPISELELPDLRLLLGQDIALSILLPIALKKLERDPFVEASFYPGDLLEVVLNSDKKYRKSNADLDHRIREMALKLFPIVRRMENDEIRVGLLQGINFSLPLPMRCPCCFCLTLDNREEFEICSVCFWEDDGQDEDQADEVLGGPNGDLSLSQARKNYLEFGACDRGSLEYVRKPTPIEEPIVF